MIVLEDCHWIDELSRDLLEVLARAAAGAAGPVRARLPAGRGHRRRARPRAPAVLPGVALSRLDGDEAAALIRSKLEQVTGRDDRRSEALVRWSTDRAGGNPFYVEELLNYLAGRGIDPTERAHPCRESSFPTASRASSSSRIDTTRRGTATNPQGGERRSAGSFDAPLLPTRLSGVRRTRRRSPPSSTPAARAGPGALDREAEQAYLFKPRPDAEVAYESMPFELRATLHRESPTDIERTEPAITVDRQLDLLAHHYWNSNDAAKQARVPGTGGREGAGGVRERRRDRLLRAAHSPARGIRSGRDHAQARQGPAAGRRASAAPRPPPATPGPSRRISATSSRSAWADASLAETAKRQSRFDEASARLEAALGRFRDLGEAAGIGDMLHLAGVIAQLQGEYGDAKSRYEDRVGSPARRIGDWAGVATTAGNLAILAEFDGDYPAALADQR